MAHHRAEATRSSSISIVRHEGPMRSVSASLFMRHETIARGARAGARPSITASSVNNIRSPPVVPHHGFFCLARNHRSSIRGRYSSATVNRPSARSYPRHERVLIAVDAGFVVVVTSEAEPAVAIRTSISTSLMSPIVAILASKAREVPNDHMVANGAAFCP